MKANRIRPHGHRTAMVILSLVVLAFLAVGVVFCFNRLRKSWHRPSVVTDVATQVVIRSGNIVSADNIRRLFDLDRPGANLAEIDFEAKREEALRRRPALRDIRISRQLPDKVTIVAEDRMPVARIKPHGGAAGPNRVVDAEGVVFQRPVRETRGLPAIETRSPGIQNGSSLDGRAKAALALIDICHDPEFQDLGTIISIGIDNPNFLLVKINTGTNDDDLKLLWEGIDEPPTPASHASLRRQLTHVKTALDSYRRYAISAHMTIAPLVITATSYGHPCSVAVRNKTDQP